MSEEKDIIGMTAETIGLDLLSAMIDEIKAMPDVWQKLPQIQQDDVIERLTKRIEDNVRQAVHIIASEDQVTVVADIESVAIKDGIKATLKIHAGNSQSAKEQLFNSVRRACMVVVTDAGDFTRGMSEVKSDADQPQLEGLDGDDSSENDIDDNDPLYSQAVQHVRDTGRPSISALQRHLMVGYNRAARLIESMEAAGIVSPMGSNGAHLLRHLQ